MNDELEYLSAKYFKKAGLAEKIGQRIGPALEIIPEIDETFDLVFLDADKREYADYYNLVFEKVRTGGYIIADNTLWNSKVLKKPSPDDAQTKGIIAFNKMVKTDSRVEKVILPLRDGLTIIRKK
jgi:predicted O-methyltransferase YrrM